MGFLTENALFLIVGYVIDLLIGDPYSFPHPVKGIGRWIAYAEKQLRTWFSAKQNYVYAGVLLLLSTVLLSATVVFFILKAGSMIHEYLEWILKIYFAYAVLSVHSLSYEGKQVKKALNKSLADGRKRVSYIVGRDTKGLSEEEVIKATIETVAENTTDGVIAPMFYYLIGGPVAAMAYKSINTLDSMVGYKNEKYMEMGKASALTDDAVNWIPARISGILFVLAAFLKRADYKNAQKVLARDHNNHNSPNAGWTESPVAGALNIQLGGTHDYFGVAIEKPTIGDSVQKPETKDIDRTIALMMMCSLLFLLIPVGILVLY